MKKLRTISFFVVILALTGITAVAQNRGIEGVKWELTKVNNRTVASSSAYIEFDDTGRFTGNGGCNQMFGSARINGSRIVFSNVGLTKRMCKLMPGSIPENRVVRELESTVRYQISGRVLTFYDRRGRVSLQFRRDTAPRPDRNGLEDRKWMLESIGNRRSTVSVRDAFVNFDEQKRSAGGNTGCNVYGGSYTTRNATISITEIMSTMRACEEGDRMDVETALLNGLRNANRYEIRDDRLYLYRGNNLLLTFRGERK
jgi:heat shock protein HslJ